MRELAGAVRNAKYLVVYTGAGISTVRRRGVGGRAPASAPRSGRNPERRGRVWGAPFWVTDRRTAESTVEKRERTQTSLRA